MDALSSFRKAHGYIQIAMIVLGLALVLSIVKNVVTERWLKQKNNVACVPADVEHSYPMVYRQTALNNTESDALMKTFVEEYIRLTKNESVVEYHRLSSNSRYDKALLSRNKYTAIEMSLDAERALNMQKYADSGEVYKTLEQGNMGWIFLIDDILLFPGPNTGTTLAVVRGEFQVVFDKVKVDLPPRLWGYRELTFLVIQGVPTKDTKENDINKYGLFVTWSTEQVLTSEQKENLDKQTSNYYLLKETN